MILIFSVGTIFFIVFLSILLRSSDSRGLEMPIVKPVERKAQPSRAVEEFSATRILQSRERTLPEKKPLPEDKKRISAPLQQLNTPMNPENQARDFYVMNFKGISHLPDGYELEDLELTEKGIMLKPLAQGEGVKPRYGVLNSPPEKMEFPSNAVSSFWKEEVAEGTSVFVEVSVSPDGESWGIWNPIYVDEDAGDPAEFYPDGTLNPNFGFRPGGVLCWGLTQYNYFRYRITLYSEVHGSPILSGFRLLYQDSTLGGGHVAKIDQEEGEKN